jgi:4-hydroxy-tetrahydrodipicolinate synthase
MVTPFTDQGQLDEARTELLARRLIEHGSDGLVVAGTTGESSALSADEREQLFYAVRRGAGTVPIYVGTGSNNTHQAVELSRQAESWGADGLLVVTPYYNKPPQEGLFCHFTQIAESVSLPIVLYNVPGRTGCILEAATVSRIASACPNVQAVKEASGRLESLEALRRECPDLYLYTGDDALFYPALTLGAHGVVSVASHVVGPEMAALLSAFRAQDTAEARRIHFLLQPIFRGLFAWPNPTAVKWVLNRLGVRVGPLRLPLVYSHDTRTMEQLATLIEEIWQRRPAAPAAAG